MSLTNAVLLALLLSYSLENFGCVTVLSHGKSHVKSERHSFLTRSAIEAPASLTDGRGSDTGLKSFGSRASFRLKLLRTDPSAVPLDTTAALPRAATGAQGSGLEKGTLPERIVSGAHRGGDPGKGREHVEGNSGGRRRREDGDYFGTVAGAPQRRTSQRRRQHREINDDADAIAPGPFSGSPCGDGFCQCSSTVANCSGHYGNLTYIPTLPAGIHSLIFTHNKLTSINSPGFFANVTDLLSLDLASNGLKYIADGAFRAMTNLRALWLYSNDGLNISQAGAAVFSVKTLVNLSLSETNAEDLAPDIFYQYHMPHLERLYLQSTPRRILWNVTAFMPLVALKYLGLANNQIIYIHTTAVAGKSFERLIALNLAQNFLSFFPRTCYYRRSIYPSLERLDLYDNHIRNISIRVCLPKLKMLDLSWNSIKVLSTGMFGQTHFPSLSTLILENLRPLKQIQAFSFNNTSLNLLSLMYNNVDFVTHIVDENGFKGLTNLTFLQLGHNYLNNDRLDKLFSGCTALEYLFLGHTFLDEIATKTLAKFSNLVEVTLSRNRFTSLPDGAFDSLKQLKRLDISNCEIAVISENTFGGETQRRLRHLDLSGNPFDCSCELLWFRDWLASDDPIFNKSYENYECSNLPQTRVASFRMNKQACLMTHDACMLTVTVIMLLILVLVLVSAVYRYRWHIRLLLYEAFRGKGQRLRLPAGYFRYDLFVSYAEEDLSWILKHLLPTLEGGLGLRLCIHQRDFIPGQNIVDNIFQSVEDSRKVLMVFSKSFARSHWCQFELSLCLNHTMDHDDALVIACVDDVTSGADLTPTMMAVLYTTTYIQWAEEADARASFWGRLNIALSEIIPPGLARVDNDSDDGGVGNIV